jgi:hypothetical protein
VKIKMWNPNTKYETKNHNATHFGGVYFIHMSWNWPSWPPYNVFSPKSTIGQLDLQEVNVFIPWCHNLNHGLTTKIRACKVAGQKGTPGVTSPAPGSARECEGMTPHTPNGLSNRQREIAGVKTHRIKKFFMSLESYWNVNV